MEHILKNLGQDEIFLIAGVIVYYWGILPYVKKFRKGTFF